MFIRILNLELKSLFRSASFGKEVAVRGILWFFYLYMLASFLILGFALYSIIENLDTDKSPLSVVNGLIPFWIMMELVARFFLQDLPTLNVKPYLLQNIKRKQVTHFVLIQSIFSFYNLLGVVAFVPFALQCYRHGDLSGTQIVAWLSTVIALILCINYLNFLVKRIAANNPLKVIPWILAAAVFVGLEYFGVFKITQWTADMVAYVVEKPVLSLTFWVVAILLYWLNFNYIHKSLYLDIALRSKSEDVSVMELSWVDKFGSLAHFMKLDLRMIWRNKRPKSVLIISVLFLAYGFIFYTNEAYQSMPAFLIFVGIFITGSFMMNFGQFVPAWDSSYYGLMLSQNIQMKTYLQSKANLMYITVVFCTIITIPYVYFGWSILFMNLAAAAFNLGINIPLLLFGGSFNKKRVDLEKSQMMNYQGTGAAQFLVMIPLLALPMGIWGIASIFTNGYWASAILGAIGIIGLLFRDQLMGLVAKAYLSRKYTTLQGFKETN